MKSIFTLETGYRTTIGESTAATKDGRILWVTRVPDIALISAGLGRLEIRESGDRGITWSNPKVLVKGDRKKSPMSLAMLRLKSGKILHIFAMFDFSGSTEDENNTASIQESTDNGKTWSKTRSIPTGPKKISNVLSICQTKTCRIIFPYEYLDREQNLWVVSAAYSDDEGKTWKLSPSVLEVGGKGFEGGACEPSVVQLPDGKLWMLIRAQTGFQWESYSYNDGALWTKARPSTITSSGTPAVLLPLSSGWIAVAWCNCVSWAYARHSLVIALTKDGKKFYGVKEIEHTDFPMETTTRYWISAYPYMCEGPDKKIIVSFNYGNWDYNKAKLAIIDPKWILEDSFNEDFREGRKEWCSLGAAGTMFAKPSSMMLPEDNKPGATLCVFYKKGVPSGLTRNFPLLFNGKIKITASVIKGDSHILLHNSFLNPGEVKEAVLRVRFASNGKVYVAAGIPQVKDVKWPKWGPKYTCLSYPIRKEVLYPKKIKIRKRFNLEINCEAIKRKLTVSINNGKKVELQTGNILGLCYIGIAATKVGSVKIRRIESKNSGGKND